ncbi:MAG: rhodanese-like domain-containing protein [Stackebrandtia sp.]
MVRPTADPPPGSQGVDQILAAARAKLRRTAPADAYLEYRAGAILADIRPVAQRAEHGEIPGSIVVERNVLEWRFDPRCEARLPAADRYDHTIIVFCQEGYTSSLAAASLRDLGLWRATDLEGGFAAWREAGLSTVPMRTADPVVGSPTDDPVHPRVTSG